MKWPTRILAVLLWGPGVIGATWCLIQLCKSLVREEFLSVDFFVFALLSAIGFVLCLVVAFVGRSLWLHPDESMIRSGTGLLMLPVFLLVSHGINHLFLYSRFPDDHIAYSANFFVSVVLSVGCYLFCIKWLLKWHGMNVGTYRELLSRPMLMLLMVMLYFFVVEVLDTVWPPVDPGDSPQNVLLMLVQGFGPIVFMVWLYRYLAGRWI